MRHSFIVAVLFFSAGGVMASWGDGVLENDGASDLISDFLETESPRVFLSGYLEDCANLSKIKDTDDNDYLSPRTLQECVTASILVSSIRSGFFLKKIGRTFGVNIEDKVKKQIESIDAETLTSLAICFLTNIPFSSELPAHDDIAKLRSILSSTADGQSKSIEDQ